MGIIFSDRDGDRKYIKAGDPVALILSDTELKGNVASTYVCDTESYCLLVSKATAETDGAEVTLEGSEELLPKGQYLLVKVDISGLRTRIETKAQVLKFSFQSRKSGKKYEKKANS